MTVSKIKQARITYINTLASMTSEQRLKSLLSLFHELEQEYEDIATEYQAYTSVIENLRYAKEDTESPE